MNASFNELWPLVKQHTLLHRYKARMLHTLVEATKFLNADIAECGVFKGGITLMMAKQLKNTGHRVWAFDSFEGLPAERNTEETCYYQAGSLKSSRDGFIALTTNNQVDSQVVLRSGFFNETLTRKDIPSFGLVHIDCDVYHSVKCCLENLYDAVLPGGIMVIDDYFDLGGGAEKAVGEHLSKTGEILYSGPIEQVFIVKGRHPSDHPDTYIGWRPEHLNSIKSEAEIDLSAIIHDLEYLNDLKSGKALPDIPGKRLDEMEKYAKRMLRVCRHHRSVLQ